MSALAEAASRSCDHRWFGKDPSPATGGGHCPQTRRSPPVVPPSLLQSQTPGTGLGIWLWLLPSPPPYLCPGCPPWVSDSVPRSLTGGLPYLPNRSLHSYPAGVCSDPSPVLELSPLLSGTVFITTAPETREAGSENRVCQFQGPSSPYLLLLQTHPRSPSRSAQPVTRCLPGSAGGPLSSLPALGRATLWAAICTRVPKLTPVAAFPGDQAAVLPAPAPWAPLPCAAASA